jgi:phenylpyruvate tautomerase PptA (4-oxalocrotonate tautomerase family)
MPNTLIEICHRYTRDEEIALMNAVHEALVEGFRIPPHDKTIRLVVHEPHRMMGPPDRAQPERFTIVTIDAFAGRTVEAKRALYKAIVRNLEPLGIPKAQVKIVVHDVPKESWGIRGGQAGCDVEIGFKVEV